MVHFSSLVSELCSWVAHLIRYTVYFQTISLRKLKVRKCGKTKFLLILLFHFIQFIQFYLVPLTFKVGCITTSFPWNKHRVPDLIYGQSTLNAMLLISLILDNPCTVSASAQQTEAKPNSDRVKWKTHFSLPVYSKALSITLLVSQISDYIGGDNHTMSSFYLKK